MSTTLLTQKYEEQLYGVLHCYDRLLFSGNLHPFCYAQGMTKFLYAQNIRIFDYPQFAEPLRDAIRANAERLAEANQIEIEFIRKQETLRKEDGHGDIVAGANHPTETGDTTGSGAYLFGHGTVSIIPTLA